MSPFKYVILGLVFFISVAAGWLTLLEYKDEGHGNHGWYLKK